MRVAALIFALALAIRIIVFLCIAWRLDLSIEQYARLYDGNSYLTTAQAYVDRAWPEDDYHARVFPGFPAAVALLQWMGCPPAWAAVGINWISASLAAALAAWLFRDWRVGIACAVLIPHYLMNSTMAMTEAPLLALTLGGLIVARAPRVCIDGDVRVDGEGATDAGWRHVARLCAGGALLGLAGLVRPMACFATAANMLALRNGRRALIFGAVALVAVIAGLVNLQWWMGDALFSYRYQSASPAAYGGSLLQWPFTSLILTPLQNDVPPARIAYIWAHVVLVVIACLTVLRAGSDTTLRRLSAVWLWSNTLFVLCIGNVWGFECFHRFTVPAMPAMFYALHRWLPRRIWIWAAITGVSAVIAAFSAGT